MPEMHLKQPGFTYSACGPFTKTKERIEKFMQTGKQEIQIIFTRMVLVELVDMACGKCKDLTKKTESHKVLKDKAFEIAANP